MTEQTKRGRPPGSEETPESLIRKELIAHLKLYRSLREMVQRKIDSAGETLQPDDLVKFMDLLRRGVVEMAKPIVAPAKADSGPKVDDEDPQKVLESLLK